MEVLWHNDQPARVRDVLDRNGRAYRYEPALSREDATVRALREVLQASGDPEAALLHLALVTTPPAQ